MIGALILGFLAGIIGRFLVPDSLSTMSGPKSWLISLVLGLAGSVVGYFIFNRWLGIGKHGPFDLGGLLSAVIGVIILLPFVGIFMRFSGVAKSG